MEFIFWLFCIRYCAYQGRKRVIGTFSGAVLGILGIFGIFLIHRSRRLLSQEELAAIRAEATGN